MRPPAAMAADVPLSRHTTLGLGGPSRFLSSYEDPEQLTRLLEWADGRALPHVALGQGSNVVASDDGFPGLVVRSGGRSLTWRCAASDSRAVSVVAAGGVEWDALVDQATQRDLHGIECLAGIPGLVGAAPIQNIGAYGQELRDTFLRLEAFDLDTEQLVELDADSCAFGYRDSALKRSPGRFIVTRVQLLLERRGRPEHYYPGLDDLLGEPGQASLPEVRDAVRRLRAAKGMIVDGADPDSRSAGSFFVNPVVRSDELDAVRDCAGALGIARESVPAWPHPDGRWKLPASWLIERSGFSRSHRRGGVAISSKHTLALVNVGEGTAEQLLSLARSIRQRVSDVFGVRLVVEPQLIGFDEATRLDLSGPWPHAATTRRSAAGRVSAERDAFR